VVPDKAERVFSFHQNTLKALQEIVQAAGLTHPRDISVHHIVRRVEDGQVRLLANLLPQINPNGLLQDDLSVQHNVFKLYWPMAKAESFLL
jgi:hypothetical protein